MRAFRLLGLALLALAAHLLGVREAGAQSDVAVVIQVTADVVGSTKERNLSFGTITPGVTATVAPSVSAGSNSGLVDVHGGIRNKTSVSLRLTFPTGLTNISMPGGATMPALWDGATVFTCTKGTALNACLGSERTWAVPAAPAGNPANYSFDFTPCAVYTTANGFVCAVGGNNKWGNNQSVYVAIGGRVAPPANIPAGTYQQTVLLTILSLN